MIQTLSHFQNGRDITDDTDRIKTHALFQFEGKYATEYKRCCWYARPRHVMTLHPFTKWDQIETFLPFNCWPCPIRSCHNRDMPKISSEYAFAHLQWHNLKSVHPTIVKVYIFGKLFLQGIQKWLYFCGRGKSKNIMADQKLKYW